jgi:DNA-binding GntR family transcriptional regulator
MSSTPVDLSRLDRASTSSKAAEFLRLQIANGTLKPGQRISELALSGQLGISRSPIREALAQLSLEGLVESIPYKGTYVKALDARRLKNLVELRVVLEEFAVRRAAEKASSRELDGMELLIEAIRERAVAGDFEGAVDADLHVHEYLIGLVSNPLLAQTYAAMLNEFRLYIRVTSRHYTRVDELATEHAALLVAMRKRRANDAVALLSAHIMHGLNDALAEMGTV